MAQANLPFFAVPSCLAGTPSLHVLLYIFLHSGPIVSERRAKGQGKQSKLREKQESDKQDVLIKHRLAASTGQGTAVGRPSPAKTEKGLRIPI